MLAVDIIDQHLERARSRYAELASRLTFERQSVFELGVADGSVDLTVCRHVLHSVPHRVVPHFLVRGWRGNSGW
ncbi:MAG: class I SAM-dependent methyltransferase [Vulcanimicrobiaceae bacterium]